MNCARAEELLPWLLNGSLDAAEAGTLRVHLAGCADCRSAWADTAWLAELAARHVPETTLVDFAAGRTLPSEDHGPVEAHIATCAACTAELSLLRESWTAHAAPEVRAELDPAEALEAGRPGRAIAARPRTTWDWRNLALAASVAGMVLGGFGYWQLQLRASGDHARQAAEIERSHREADEARGGRVAAEARLAELEAPQVNAQIAELMPQELVLRGAPAPLPVLSVPAAGRILLLLYAPPAEAGKGDYEVELRDSQGALLWAAQGLRRTSSGDFSLSLPTALLAEGAAEIRVLAPGDGRAVVARYRFAVQRGSES
ncbi:MAG: zf-HC2 protein [Acidobacteriota bacterium]|nr:zf-HC2 protein [Acidobacteriota bacterium]